MKSYVGQSFSVLSFSPFVLILRRSAFEFVMRLLDQMSGAALTHWQEDSHGGPNHFQHGASCTALH